MGLPGHRRTSSHKRRRAAHFALTEGAMQTCSHCQKPVRPHRACAFCGYYKGRPVMVTSRMKKLERASKPAAKKPATRKKKAAATETAPAASAS